MNTMTDVAGKVWSWAVCQSIRARQHAGELLQEESAQGTTEYAIVTVALLSIVLAIAGLWRAGTDGHLAALVERAASHGVASTSVIDAAAGAKDIALY